MTLALQLVTYNSSVYLPFLFDSLAQQTDQDWTLFILDNSNREERGKTRSLVETYDKRLSIRYEESAKNIGFAGGHQRLFTEHDAELIQLVNPDVILDPDSIATLRRAFESWEELGSATGAIFRWEWKGGQPNKTQDVDSLGLHVAPSGKVTDLTGGQDGSVPDEMRQVFGVSGCLPMVRRAAVEQASCDGHLFDPLYVIYKEDVDLAYRLYAGGWIAALVPQAKAYHYRAFKPSWLHRDASRFLQFYSYRNHLWNTIVYTSWREGLLRSWALVPFELAKFFFLLAFHPSIVRDTIRDTRQHWAHLINKRMFYAHTNR
ncbi:hypothetical protein COV06_03895 [Candidatus Uhrbacteria bacterium CG10_big_fil_rev_8_21_14_0_10_50_16]|uniref:Glycosyltransferase 2-like domain-containing protein n=1 Tax=Candidatus Uhrbacteria bacterium CG10_big_fil_rev_8_21_14_0_10_50_16 TaxID=1975039 RepID=A0A2H0RNQ2_9BACT|nr:MAG: hypothetical protein COV06_03895 [Candidatus Uhrbacteria bacterium CG10_big_fil_rev_8_21_14_0_10_50_16]